MTGRDMTAHDMTGRDAGVCQATARVAGNAPAAAYRHLTLDAPGIAQLAQPGQFVALTVGGPTSALLLRRSFSIHRVDPAAGTVEIVVSDAGPGTAWITRLADGESVDIVGPLGRGFTLPDAPGAAVLIGGGYGSAPMFWLANVLRENGFSIHHVLGAASADRLFGAELADPADELIVTTDDGSQGERGWVSDPLPGLLERTGAKAVYACGPMGMLRAVTEIATAHGARAEVAVEEAMACGIGVCMTCVLPVVGADGVTRMSRSCVDGPIFDATTVRWDAVAGGRVAVPADCLGAPR